MASGTQSTVGLGGLFSRLKRLQRRQKIFLYVSIVLVLSLLFAPLVKVTSALLIQDVPGENYTVFSLFTRSYYTYEQGVEGAILVERSINTSTFGLGLLMLLIVGCMTWRNISYRGRKYMYMFMGYKVSEHVVNTIVLLFLLFVILAMTNSIAMLQLSRVSLYMYSIIWLTLVILAMTVRQLYLVLYSIQEKKQKKYSTPFSSSDLLYQQAIQQSREPQDDELVGGLFVEDKEK